MQSSKVTTVWKKTSTLYLMILTFSLALGAVQLVCLSCEEGTPKIAVEKLPVELLTLHETLPTFESLASGISKANDELINVKQCEYLWQAR